MRAAVENSFAGVFHPHGGACRVSKWMQPINMIMIYYWNKHNGAHLEKSYKNAFSELEISNQCFFNCYYISFQDMQLFFEFLASVMNHYHTNGLHLFLDFWMILSANKLWRKIFFLSCPRHCYRELIVVIAYYFQIWNQKKKKHYFSESYQQSHGAHVYWDTLYFLNQGETKNKEIER